MGWGQGSLVPQSGPCASWGCELPAGGYQNLPGLGSGQCVLGLGRRLLGLPSLWSRGGPDPGVECNMTGLPGPPTGLQAAGFPIPM